MNRRGITELFALHETPPGGGAPPDGGGGGGAPVTPPAGPTVADAAEIAAMIQAAVATAMTGTKAELKKDLDGFSAIRDMAKKRGLKLEDIVDAAANAKKVGAVTPPGETPPEPTEGGDKLWKMELERRLNESEEKTKIAETRTAEIAKRKQEGDRDQQLTSAMEAAGVKKVMIPLLLESLRAKTTIEGDQDTYKVYVKWSDPRTRQEYNTPLEQNPVVTIKALLPSDAFEASGSGGSGGRGPGELRAGATADEKTMAALADGGQAAYEKHRNEILASEKARMGNR